MSDDQKTALLEAVEAEKTVILVELDDAQQRALEYLNIVDKRDEIAAAAFAAVIRGKVQSAADRAIKEKYLADGKGKTALAAEYEKEIQSWLKLKREL